MNDFVPPEGAPTPALIEHLRALEAEVRRQASVISAMQRSHEMLQQRYFALVLRVDRLERGLGTPDRRAL